MVFEPQIHGHTRRLVLLHSEQDDNCRHRAVQKSTLSLLSYRGSCSEALRLSTEFTSQNADKLVYTGTTSEWSRSGLNKVSWCRSVQKLVGAPSFLLVLHVTQGVCTVLHVTNGVSMAHVNQRVQKHREALRMAGLRPVQIWVPDTRRPDFADECRRQCLLVAQADSADTAMQQFMDEALADVDGWTE